MESRKDERPEADGPAGGEGSPLEGMFSDLLETEAGSPEPAPELPDPDTLEVDSTPPPPAPPGLPEPAVIEGFFDELAAGPLPAGDEEPRPVLQPALVVERAPEPGPEAVEEPAAEPAAEAAERSGISAQAVTGPESEDVPDEPVFPTPAEAAGSEPTAEAFEAAPPAGPSVAETPEARGGAAPEGGPAAAAEPEFSALDDLVAEIDEETGGAFQEEQRFTFESELPAKEVREGDSCIVFLLDGTRYAVPIRNVVETDTAPRTTSVPNVPVFVQGVTNVRGEIISVLDLRSLFGMQARESAERGRILIVRTADQQTAALAVDEVRGTASFSLSAIGPPAGPVHDKVMPVLLGVTEHQGQVLNVLDVDGIFRMQEMQQFTAG